MPFLIGLAGAVIAAIGAVVAVVTVMVVSLVVTASALIAAALSAVIGAIGVVVGVTVEALTIGMNVLVGTLEAITIDVSTILNFPMLDMEIWAESLKLTFTAFTDAIHLKTLMAIHDIAIVVSSSYRAQVQAMYAQIGVVSEAIGATAGFLQNAIHSARMGSLQASSFLGKGYDISEVVWLSELETLLKRVETTADEYEANPAKIFTDIDELIIKPAIDAKALAQQTILGTIEGLVNVADDFIRQISETKRSLDDFMDKMPDFVQERVAPLIHDLEETFDSWYNDVYYPAKSTADAIIDSVYSRTTETAANLLELSAKIANPGDIIESIKDMPDEARAEQLAKITDTLVIPLMVVGEELSRQLKEEPAGLQSVLDALKFEIIPVVYDVKEISITTLSPVDRVKISTLFYAGDY